MILSGGFPIIFAVGSVYYDRRNNIELEAP